MPDQPKPACSSCGHPVPAEIPDHHCDPAGPHPHAPLLARGAFRLCGRCYHAVLRSKAAGRYGSPTQNSGG